MNRVLIIDDDKELCALMKKCIEQENLTALVAYCGAEGLRLVDENKDDRSLTLIILDIMLPDIDGFQVLKKIREGNNLPILMLTAKTVKMIKFRAAARRRRLSELSLLASMNLWHVSIL